MAGIGFELKKLFAGRGVFRKVRAYSYASVVCAGTVLLAIVLLLGMQALIDIFRVSRAQKEVLVGTMVYALFFSMMFTSVYQTFLSRYVADQLYHDHAEKIMPSLMGASITLMIPGGIFYAFLVNTADALTIMQKILNWLLFLELIPVWLQMSYITAAKDYRAILLVFGLGVIIALLLGALLLILDVIPYTALMAALVVGYGVMLCGFMKVLLQYFPLGKGSVFSFIGWLSKTPDLLLTGFMGTGGMFVHICVMWFSPLGSIITGQFRQASLFDACAFYGFLIILPTTINFVVSVEVNFYLKYRDYFDAITGGGTIRQINQCRESMLAVLKQEISKMAWIQVFFLVAYIIIMRFALPYLGFTTDMIRIFQVLTIGYSAYTLGNSLMLLQLYFNDRKGAMVSAAVLFFTNLLISLWTRTGPSIYYGLGMAAGGLAMYMVALPQLLAYVRHIDFHVFCSQPVTNAQEDGFFLRLANRLDKRAANSKKEDIPL